MDFRAFVEILLARWKLATSALLLCLVGAAAVTVFQNKAYQSSATLLLSISGETDVTEVYWGGQAAQDRLSSYAEIAGGRAVAERAVSQLQLPISPGALVRQTQVKYTPKSMLFTITVTDSDPKRAALLAGGMADAFTALVPTLDANPRTPRPGTPQMPTSQPTTRATVVKEPEVPSHPSRPVPVRNMAMGLVAGLLLGIVVALARDAGDRTVRSRRKLEQLSGLPTLAELPRERGRAPRSATDVKVDDAVRGLRTRLLRAMGPEARRVLVAAPFGGEGTTTTALNLALAFAELGDRVLLIEGDTRRPVIAGLFEVKSGEGLANALADPTIAAEAVAPTAISKLFVLASRFARRETVPCGAYPPEVIDTVLKDLSARFDRVVVDGPPVLATTDSVLLAGAVEATVLVVRARRTTTDEINDALNSLRSAGAEVVGTVLTDAPVPRHIRAAARMYRAKANESP
ncbi:polysaccharide biosynthesis tyrosine autokinase [Mycobacterium sp. SMC-2]|uniref:polysaccharide biosynthesis tyrosine autokinase n=1 Tax=Mycobacterium sp. SMC-2 TaxID=2857058 RepID=UPI0021B17302|nr:polysaccharide biosynthesis tyrosine autokinase [Mycobacterium sp. SMC-2]UXA07472.1 polysaccharide biosynthesis tyrosine autokinase [Mycobacterium sp. SMC-2]